MGIFKKNKISPVTGELMENTNLTSNNLVKQFVDVLLKSKPYLAEYQYKKNFDDKEFSKLKEICDQLKYLKTIKSLKCSDLYYISSVCDFPVIIELFVNGVNFNVPNEHGISPCNWFLENPLFCAKIHGHKEKENIDDFEDYSDTDSDNSEQINIEVSKPSNFTCPESDCNFNNHNYKEKCSLIEDNGKTVLVYTRTICL